ncbi:MAG: hypothetical protein WD607_00325 [Candidatus Paceibacterota bacterium]
MNEIMKIMSQSKYFKKALVQPDKKTETYRVQTVPPEMEEFSQEEMEMLVEQARNREAAKTDL